jgi:signal peptidase I
VRNPVDRFTVGLPHGLRVAIDWVVTIVGAVGIVLLLKTFVVNPYRIPSSSMEPTLHCAGETGCLAERFSDRVLANRLVYRFKDPRRGDVIVFDTPPLAAERCGTGGTYVKRLIALPGETWRMEDGTVYIDGRELVEPYLSPERKGHDTVAPELVPEGRYLMLGDNRDQSCDSRAWGTVDRERLIGKVVAVYWPPDRISFR